jgi:DNA polymerase-3 subunit epsilon
MKSVLLLDVEATTLEPKTGSLIEVGAVLWSVEFRSIIECFSGVMHAAENPAEHVNGIPAGLVSLCTPGFLGPVRRVDEMAEVADAIVAHKADFDRSWIEPCGFDVVNSTPWICTIEDFVWPKPSASKSLTALALAHGVAVVSAHRAIHDVLLLARCFEVIPDIGERLEAALAHAQLPKAEMISLAPFEQKDVVKEAGFHWDSERKVWHRTMAIEDAKKLPFATRVAK